MLLAPILSSVMALAGGTRNRITTLPADIVGSKTRDLPANVKMWGGFVDVRRSKFDDFLYINSNVDDFLRKTVKI